jgi:hypothetical protein
MSFFTLKIPSRGYIGTNSGNVMALALTCITLVRPQNRQFLCLKDRNCCRRGGGGDGVLKSGEAEMVLLYVRGLFRFLGLWELGFLVAEKEKNGAKISYWTP